MCPGSVTVPDCANVDLIITVSNATASTNKPFANTDMATTTDQHGGNLKHISQ